MNHGSPKKVQPSVTESAHGAGTNRSQRPSATETSGRLQIDSSHQEEVQTSSVCFRQGHSARGGAGFDLPILQTPANTVNTPKTPKAKKTSAMKYDQIKEENLLLFQAWISSLKLQLHLLILQYPNREAQQSLFTHRALSPAVNFL